MVLWNAGVEDVSADSKAHKVVVKGKKAAADPMKVVERVQKKTGRKVELLSPIPATKEEEKKEEEKKEEPEPPKPEEKKEEVNYPLPRYFSNTLALAFLLSVWCNINFACIVYCYCFYNLKVRH